MLESSRPTEFTDPTRVGSSAVTNPCNARLDVATLPQRTRIEVPASLLEQELQTSDVQGVPLDSARPRRGPKRGLALTFATTALVGVVAWQTSGTWSDPDTGAISEEQRREGLASSGEPLLQGPPLATADHLPPGTNLTEESPQHEAPSAALGSAFQAAPFNTGRTAPKAGAPGARKGAGAVGSRPKRSSEPKAVTSTCSPPTYVDSEGIRHFKPECL